MKWIISFLFIFNCCSINLKSVLQGKELDKAIETDLKIFFERRITNTIKKALYVGNWEILFEDEEFVYYGKGSFSLLSFIGIERINLEELFKVSKKELIEKFPIYKKFDGRVLKSQYCSEIYSNTKLNKNETLKFYQNCKANLLDKEIFIEVEIHTSKRIISKNKKVKFEEIEI